MRNALILIFVVILCAQTTRLSATPRKSGQETKAPPCDISKLTPYATKSLATMELRETAIVPTVSYYSVPCFRATVDFVIAEKVGHATKYQDFYFDSIGNQPIDTKTKCDTYQQSTEIYHMVGGKWKLVSKGRLRGEWFGGKCKFNPPAGGIDFRGTKYSPVYNVESRYRMVSTVTTGKGVVWGPTNQPATASAIEVKAKGQAIANQICFAVEHLHNDNTPIEGCADPVP